MAHGIQVRNADTGGRMTFEISARGFSPASCARMRAFSAGAGTRGGTVKASAATLSRSSRTSVWSSAFPASSCSKADRSSAPNESSA